MADLFGAFDDDDEMEVEQKPVIEQIAVDKMAELETRKKNQAHENTEDLISRLSSGTQKRQATDGAAPAAKISRRDATTDDVHVKEEPQDDEEGFAFDKIPRIVVTTIANLPNCNHEKRRNLLYSNRLITILTAFLLSRYSPKTNCSFANCLTSNMRNYQYTSDEERAMDEFAKEWKRNNRGIRGPSAWREFKVRHPWAQRITADALRQKYSRMKRDQYWAAFARRHINCPRGHAVCYAGGIPARHDYDSVDNEPEQTQAPIAQPQAPTATATPIETHVLTIPQPQTAIPEPVTGQAPAAPLAVQTTSFHTARDVSPTPRTARSASPVDTARPTTSALSSVFTARSPNLTDYNTVYGTSSTASLVSARENSMHSAVTARSMNNINCMISIDDINIFRQKPSTSIATARSSSDVSTSQEVNSTNAISKVQNTGLASYETETEKFCEYLKRAHKLHELVNSNEDNLVIVSDNAHVGAELVSLLREFKQGIAINQARCFLNEIISEVLGRFEAHFDPSAEGSLPNLLRSGAMHSVLDNLRSYLIDEFDKLFKACLVHCGLPSNATLETLHESRSVLRTALEQLSSENNGNILASLGFSPNTVTARSSSDINTARSTNSASSAQTPGLVTCIDDENSGERLCNYVKRLMRLYQLMSGNKMCLVTVNNKQVEGADLAAIVRIFEEPIQTAIDQVRNLLSDVVDKMLGRYEAHFDPNAEGALTNLVRSGVMRELLDHLKKYLFYEFDKFVHAALDSVKRNDP